MTGGSPPSKMQLDVVQLSSLNIRGRCLEHLPKGCSGSWLRSILSWARSFQNTSAAQPRRPLKTKGGQVSDSNLALGLLALGNVLSAPCTFHIKYPQEKKDGQTSLLVILNTFASTYLTDILGCRLLRVALGRKNFVPNYFCPCGLNV